MHRFKVEDITGFFLQLDTYEPRRMYIMRTPTNRTHDHLTFDLGKPVLTARIRTWVSTSRRTNQQFFSHSLREAQGLIAEDVRRLGNASTHHSREDCRSVVMTEEAIRIYTQGLITSGGLELLWQYVPYKIKRELLGID